MAPSPQAPEGKHPSIGALPALRVLVVDDDRDTVLTLTTLLRDEGYDTKGVYQGNEVMAALRDFEADAVILDIGMPDRNGYDVARQIRQRYGEQRPMIIALTAWTKPSDRMLAQMAGFNHHMPKPCDPNLLSALLAPLKLPRLG